MKLQHFLKLQQEGSPGSGSIFRGNLSLNLSTQTKIMLLWLLVLLVGCVVGVPVQKAYDGGSGFNPRSMHQHPASSSDWLNPNANQQIASSQGAGQYGGSPTAFHSPQSADWVYGFAGYPDSSLVQPVAPSGDGEHSEAFFTDTSGLTPIYTYGSRSRYQNARAVFAQTRYIPGDPVHPPMPIIYSQRSGGRIGPADPLGKGGY